MLWFLTLLAASAALFHVLFKRARERAGIHVQPDPISLLLRLFWIGVPALSVLIGTAWLIIDFHLRGVHIAGFLWGGLLASMSILGVFGYTLMR
jgi:hypothetical protein